VVLVYGYASWNTANSPTYTGQGHVEGVYTIELVKDCFSRKTSWSLNSDVDRLEVDI